MIYIFWTAPGIEEAKRLSKQLVEKKWVACASILPNVLSIYHWDGKIQEEYEVKVILKTEKRLFDQVRSFIQEESSYDVSEISMIKIDDANPNYEKWVEEYLEK
jgi:periplasmic divalent cation tolerance protein